jgi:ribosomal protein L34E
LPQNQSRQMIEHREPERETCPACGSERASVVCVNPTPAERSPFSHPDLPKDFIPVRCVDVQCWECGERNEVVDYAPPPDSATVSSSEKSGERPQ